MWVGKTWPTAKKASSWIVNILIGKSFYLWLCCSDHWQILLTFVSCSQTQLSRYKEQLEKGASERDDLVTAKTSAEEVCKRAQKQLRELRDELAEAQKREMEAVHKSKEQVTLVFFTKVSGSKWGCQQKFVVAFTACWVPCLVIFRVISH